MIGRAAITQRDDGDLVDPRTDADWLDWVAARDIRNWCDDDLLLDWLSEFGEQHGFRRDDQLPGYDRVFDLARYLMDQGRRFEQAVLVDLQQRWPVTRISTRPDEARSLTAAEATWDAMKNGAPVVASAVLRDPERRTFGVADLLVRSDVLGELCPDAFIGDQLELPVAAMRHGRHYRVVDIKFSTLHLLKDGGLGADSLDVMAQAWIYNEALGRIQGFTPPAAYVAGRAWRQGAARGDRCWERMARVPRETFVRSRDEDLGAVVARGIAWVRRLRTEGAEWRVLPIPSVPELWPNMKAGSDFPWHTAKAEIAAKLGELTILPRVNVDLRTAAHAVGVTRWDDARTSANLLGLDGQHGRTLDAVIAVNRDAGDVLRPERVSADEEQWRVPPLAEAFVDFEFVHDMDDDFSAFPQKGGQALIFQIGSGTYRDRRWAFRQFTVDDLGVDAEARMIDDWLAHLDEVAREAGCSSASDVRLVHWSLAEESNFERAYESARSRHPDRSWPPLAWYDLLGRVFRAQPIVVKGAFSFGLKSIARAMRAHGLIETQWGEGLADGAGAMAGAWAAAADSRARGRSLTESPVMQEIARYNEVDCRVMAEILDYLRRER
ncbi:MAG TPA: hypothetical protein VFA31_05305 [Candidatus Polarisedimenticolia bacterium]|nr:hypothetical protein [Candidatus Polarisedimenticolia bacterium]